MTERMASGWMTVWRLDMGAKAIRKDVVKMVKQRYNLAISPRKVEECKSSAGEAYEELKEKCTANIIFAVIHV